MATRRRQRSSKNFTFAFDSGLQTAVRAELIIELVKYILYEREQIPLPIDQVKKNLNHAKSQADQRRGLFSRLETKKADAAVSSLDEIASNLRHVFQLCPHVKQAAVILGATVVSPKEVYMIELPPLSPEMTNMDAKTCLKSLFRQLIMHDPLRDLKKIPKTKLMLLINAPRDVCSGWFNAKATYSVPDRGRHFSLTMVTTSNMEMTEDLELSQASTAFELSGFEPLERTCLDMSVDDSGCSTESARRRSSHYYLSMQLTPTEEMSFTTGSSQSSASTSTIADQSSLVDETDVVDSPSLSLCSSAKCAKLENDLCPSRDCSVIMEDNSDCRETQNEFIWYQAPVSVKGYSDKSSKQGR